MTDMRFVIAGRTRRNMAASRLKREGYAVQAVPAPRDATDHMLDVLGVEDADLDVEQLVAEVAPGAVRTL